MLNQNDKIERFAEVINKNAEKQCAKIEKQAAQFLKKELSELETQSKKEFETRLAFEKSRIKNETNKSISALESQSKKKIANKRDEIMNSVFSKAKSRLVALTKSDKYYDILHSSIEKLCKEIEKDVTIYVSADDLELAKKAAVDFSCINEVLPSDEIEIGGAFASNADKSVFVYDTLDARLESRKEVFMSTSGLAQV